MYKRSMPIFLDEYTIEALHRAFHELSKVLSVAAYERKNSADRTRSPRQRAGSRRNKKLRNVRPFFSDER